PRLGLLLALLRLVAARAAAPAAAGKPAPAHAAAELRAGFVRGEERRERDQAQARGALHVSEAAWPGPASSLPCTRRHTGSTTWTTGSSTSCRRPPAARARPAAPSARAAAAPAARAPLPEPARR